MTDIMELAQRVEALDGPNYAMEVEIFKALHPEYAGYVAGRGGLVHPCDGSDARVLSDVRPGNYTASVDSALALIPKGWRLSDLHQLEDGNWTMLLWHGPATNKLDNPPTSFSANAATAICAAALRARASLSKE